MADQQKSSSPLRRERLQMLVAQRYSHKSRPTKRSKAAPLTLLAQEAAVAADVERPIEFVPGLSLDTFAGELRAMQNHSFCFSEKYHEQQGRADRTAAQPELLDFVRKFRKVTFKLGIPMFPHCINRGSQEQNRLFKTGRSRARAGESAHNYGAAVDYIHSIKAWNLTRKQWEVIGHVGKEVAKSAGLKMQWGGDWDFYDPAHWELANWREIRARYSDGEDWDGRPSR